MICMIRVDFSRTLNYQEIIWSFYNISYIKLYYESVSFSYHCLVFLLKRHFVRLRPTAKNPGWHLRAQVARLQRRLSSPKKFKHIKPKFNIFTLLLTKCLRYWPAIAVSLIAGQSSHLRAFPLMGAPQSKLSRAPPFMDLRLNNKIFIKIICSIFSVLTLYCKWKCHIFASRCYKNVTCQNNLFLGQASWILYKTFFIKIW